MSKILKKLLSFPYYYSGTYQKRWQQFADCCTSTAVLCYHRIVHPEQEQLNCFNVEKGLSVEVFEAQMRFMLKYFEPINASQIHTKTNKPFRFVVTFDDGTDDNYTVAAPILEKLGIPATFFVISDWIGSKKLFWWQQAGNLLRETSLSHLDLQQLDVQWCNQQGVSAVLSLQGIGQKEKAHSYICQILTATNPQDIQSKLLILKDLLQVNSATEARHSGLDLMTWEQLQNLQDRGFEIGGHTATHTNLDLLEQSQYEAEVFQSTELLRSKLSKPVTSFAYPYGRRLLNQNQAAQDALVNAGYRQIFSTVPGMVRMPPNAKNETNTVLPRFKLNKKYAFACAYNIQNAILAAS